MPHRETISSYLRTIALDGQTIIDWGRGTKPVTNYITATNCKYIGIDKLGHVGADMVLDIASEVDLARYGEPPNGVFEPKVWDMTGADTPEPITADWAFCMEVLEHVLWPEVVLQNIHRHLKKDGTLVLSAPFRYPIHSPEDYWRWTDQGLTVLLERNGFKVLEILSTEDEGGWVLRATRLD